jgi:hypothetical protein
MTLADAYADTANRMIGTLQRMSVSARGRYDTYVLSPAHLVMTGRRGASTLLGEKTLLPLCRHPNVDNEVLVFPEVNEDGRYDLTFDVFARLFDDDRIAVRLARFTDTQKHEFIRQCRAKTDGAIDVHAVVEDVLDWRYPTYVLDTASVGALNGGTFEQVRQRLHKVDESVVEFRSINMDRDADEIIAFIQQWAAARVDDDEAQHHLIGPTLAAIELMSTDPNGINGLSLYIHGALAAYAIWELPLVEGLPANILVNCAAHKPGIGEWLFVGVCRSLAEQHITGLNVGGSESHGLDRYKRKFGNPTPIPLNSLLITNRSIN